MECSVQLDMSEGQKLNPAIHLCCAAGNIPLFSSPNDSEQYAAHNALQDFISDSHSKPAVVCFPQFHNHYKYGINGKRVKQAF